jgi:hypothetical protein
MMIMMIMMMLPGEDVATILQVTLQPSDRLLMPRHILTLSGLGRDPALPSTVHIHSARPSPTVPGVLTACSSASYWVHYYYNCLSSIVRHGTSSTHIETRVGARGCCLLFAGERSVIFHSSDSSKR